ncbi:MAG: tRNA adenosine(34) deaminase TadA [Bdellovibrionota bacterium]
MASDPQNPSQITSVDDAKFMKLALNLASEAALAGEVPVGALIVLNGEIIAQAGNTKEAEKMPTHHAELKAIEAAALKLGRWRLSDCELYVTLEPCSMCAGAIVQARLKRLIFGARDPKAGAVRSLYELVSDPRLNHRAEITEGVLANECGAVLSAFFKKRRLEK